MKSVNIDVLKSTAHSLMFDMSEDEYNQLVSDFLILLEQMQIFDQLDNLGSYSPMTFPFDVTSEYLREDVSSPCLSKEEVVKNSACVKGGQIVIPGVIKK